MSSIYLILLICPILNASLKGKTNISTAVLLVCIFTKTFHISLGFSLYSSELKALCITTNVNSPEYLLNGHFAILPTLFELPFNYRNAEYGLSIFIKIWSELLISARERIVTTLNILFVHRKSINFGNRKFEYTKKIRHIIGTLPACSWFIQSGGWAIPNENWHRSMTFAWLVPQNVVAEKSLTIVVSSTMNPKIARISALVIRTERKYNEIHSNAFEFEVLFLLLNEYDVKDSSRRVKISRMNRIELKVNILIFIYTALYRFIPRNPKNQYLNSWSFKRHVCWAHVSAVNVLLSLRLRWFQYEHLPFLIPSFIHTVTSNVKY